MHALKMRHLVNEQVGEDTAFGLALKLLIYQIEVKGDLSNLIFKI